MTSFAQFVGLGMAISACTVQAQSTLPTTYVGGSQSPSLAFDLVNLTQAPMRVYAIAINSTEPGGAFIEGLVRWRPGTAAGNLGSPAGWDGGGTFIGTSGGAGNPSLCHFGGPWTVFSLPPGQTVGVLVSQYPTAAQYAQNWSSSPPALPAYANTELSLTAVAAMSTISFGGALTAGAVFNGTIYYTFEPPCYPNCDNSLNPPFLNVNDFNCFINSFQSPHPSSNCDGSTAAPIFNVNDFLCFVNAFAAGCSVP